MATDGAWIEPGSRRGLLEDVGWMVLGVAVFAAIALFEPGGVTIDSTPTRVLGASVLGGVLGVALIYLPALTERIHDVWADKRFKFAALFTVALAVQVLLRVAPTWTVLTALATALVAIPVRLLAYRRATLE